MPVAPRRRLLHRRAARADPLDRETVEEGSRHGQYRLASPLRGDRQGRGPEEGIRRRRRRDRRASRRPAGDRKHPPGAIRPTGSEAGRIRRPPRPQPSQLDEPALPKSARRWLSLADLIAIARELKGWSLRDLEAQAGVSNALLSQIETGKV